MAAGESEQAAAVRIVKTGGLKLEVAALIMSGQEGGPIPVEVLALPLAADGGKVRVSLVIEAAGEGLLAGPRQAGDAGAPLRVEIYAYAIDGGGGLHDSLMQTFEIDPAPLDARLERSGIQFTGDLDVVPGQYSLRVMVRNPRTGDVGLRVVPLVAAGAGEPTLSPPWLAAAGEAWLPVGERTGAPRPAPPWLARQPAAKPVLAAGGTVTFRLLGCHLSAVGANLSVELRDPGGRNLEVPARLEADEPAAAAGCRVLTASFDAGGLRPGEHRLRAMLSGSEGGKLESPSLPLVILDDARPGEATAQRRTWAEAARERPSSPAAAGASERTAAAPAAAVDEARYRDAYTRILKTLAGGDQTAASADLLALASTAAGAGGDALATLTRVEIDAARALGEADPKCLTPVMMLSHGLYLEARRRGFSQISTHARTSVIQMVDLYLDAGMSWQAKKAAAQILASLGGELQRANLIRLGDQLLLKVLLLDRNNAAALLGLAVSQEKHGLYEAAVARLHDLVDSHPDHRHGRLRLAINLGRLGNRKAARRHLGTILENDANDWVTSLAYQELARHHLLDNRQEEAEEVLRQGLARLPGDEKLHLQLAFLQDARQEGELARQTLQEMALRGRRNGAPPRRRYTRWPTEDVAAGRRAVAAEAEARLPELAAALAAVSGGKAGP